MDNRIRVFTEYFGIGHHPPASVLPMIEKLVSKRFSAGEKIVEEGTESTGFYFIVRGSVVVTRKSTFGSRIVCRLGAKDIVGVNPGALFDLPLRTWKRTADVVCLSDVDSYFLSIDDYNGVLKDKPELMSILIEEQNEQQVRQFARVIAQFEDLEEDQMSDLLKHIERQWVKKGEYLYREGDKADYVYFILRGEVSIKIKDRSGNAREITRLKDNQIVGDIAALSDERRGSRVLVIEDTLVLRLEVQFFKKYIARVPSAMSTIRRMRDNRIRPILRKKQVMTHYRKRSDGTTAVMLENTQTHKFVEVSSWVTEHMLPLLDGYHSMHGIVLRLSERKIEASTSEIANTLHALIQEQFADVPAIKVPSSTAKRSRSLSDLFTRVLTYTHDFEHLSRPLDRFYRYFGFLFFNWPAYILTLLIITGGFVCFLFNYSQAMDTLHSDFIWPILGLNYVMFWAATLGHELAHAMAAIHSQTKVHRGGFGWYWISSFAFVDTSAMWTRPVAERLKVNIAGVYFNALAAGAVSLMSFYGFFSDFWMGAFWLFAFFSYLVVLTNMSSFLEYDGYYILMDLLDKPNLRAHSYIWMVDEVPNMRQKNPFKGHAKEVTYWIYTLCYLTTSILVTQLIVIDLLWPLLGWKDSTSPVSLGIRLFLIVLVLYLATVSVLKEAKQFKAAKQA